MKLSFDEADLRPVIEQIVAATLVQIQTDEAKFADKIAYTEPEAAAILSIRPHVLRDARLRGEISGHESANESSTSGTSFSVFSAGNANFDGLQ